MNLTKKVKLLLSAASMSRAACESVSVSASLTAYEVVDGCSWMVCCDGGGCDGCSGGSDD